MRYTELEKYLSDVPVSYLSISLAPKDGMGITPIESIQDNMIYSFDELKLYIEEELKEAVSDIDEYMDWICGDSGLNKDSYDPSINVVFINSSGIYVEDLDKDTMKSFEEQFIYLLSNSKATTSVKLDIKDFSIESIHTEFAIKNSRCTYGLFWHPKIIRLMQEHDICFIGNCTDESGDHNKDAAILVYGYEKLRKTERYFGTKEDWDFDPFVPLLLIVENNKIKDFLSIYNFNSIKIDKVAEKQPEW